MRYGEFAGGGYANMCVPTEPDASTGSAEGSTSSPTLPTTTMLPSTGSDSASTGDTEISPATNDGSTGSPAQCELAFHDEFEDRVLPDHWTALGAGTVGISVGELRIGVTPEVGDPPTWLRHEPSVSFENVWLRAEIDDIPSDGLQAILSLARDTGMESYDLVADAEGQLTARRTNEDGTSIDLATVDSDWRRNSWVRIRERSGRVLFEFGPSAEEWVAFHEADEDIRGWAGTFYVGADNDLEVDVEEPISYESLSACVVP